MRGDRSWPGFSYAEGVEDPAPCSANNSNNLVEIPIISWLLPLEEPCCGGRSSSDAILGSNRSFFPVFLSWSRWWPPLPSQPQQFVSKSFFICKLKFHGGCLAKGGKCFEAGQGWGFADAGWIPQHPAGTGYQALPLPWERRSQIQPDELQNLLWVWRQIPLSGAHPGARGLQRGRRDGGGLGGGFAVKLGGFGDLIFAGHLQAQPELRPRRRRSPSAVKRGRLPGGRN